MNDTNVDASMHNSFPILHILTIIFVLSKILGYIDWSWFLVLLPTIIRYILDFIEIIICFSILKNYNKSFWTGDKGN